MQTISNGTVPSAQIDALDAASQALPGAEIQELLQSLVNCLREGDDIVAITPNSALTPNQVAQRLGMSRTHLYKLLDSGAIESHRVGRDRRIRVTDVIKFETQRHSDRRELAERFASQDRTQSAATNEPIDLF